MLTIASIASIIRCKAESVPIVMSVPQKSLSMEPTYNVRNKLLIQIESYVITKKKREYSQTTEIVGYKAKNKLLIFNV